MPRIEGIFWPIDPRDHVLLIFVAARLTLHDSTLVAEKGWHTVARKKVV